MIDSFEVVNSSVSLLLSLDFTISDIISSALVSVVKYLLLLMSIIMNIVHGKATIIQIRLTKSFD